MPSLGLYLPLPKEWQGKPLGQQLHKWAGSSPSSGFLFPDTCRTASLTSSWALQSHTQKPGRMLGSPSFPPAETCSITLGGRSYYFPHSTEEGTEVQSGPAAMLGGRSSAPGWQGWGGERELLVGFQGEGSRLVKVYGWGGSEPQEVGGGRKHSRWQEEWMRMWNMYDMLRIQFAWSPEDIHEGKQGGLHPSLECKAPQAAGSRGGPTVAG